MTVTLSEVISDLKELKREMALITLVAGVDGVTTAMSINAFNSGDYLNGGVCLTGSIGLAFVPYIQLKNIKNKYDSNGKLIN